MHIRSFLLNMLVVLFGFLSAVAGLFILVTGVDLRYASADEAFVATWIPYLYIVIGLVAASLLFWRQRLR